MRAGREAVDAEQHVIAMRADRRGRASHVISTCACERRAKTFSSPRSLVLHLHLALSVRRGGDAVIRLTDQRREGRNRCRALVAECIAHNGQLRVPYIQRGHDVGTQSATCLLEECPTLTKHTFVVGTQSIVARVRRDNDIVDPVTAQRRGTFHERQIVGREHDDAKMTDQVARSC